MKNSLIVYPCRGQVDGYLGDKAFVTPPLTVTEEDVMELAVRLDKTLTDIERKVL